jgi:hypothetical protein
MSDKPTEENPGQQDLAQVLNRINALTKNRPEDKELPQFDEGIPLLTEVYEGAVPDLSARPDFLPQAARIFPNLNQIRVSEAEARALSPELVERLMAEMAPLIEEAVKKAVKSELKAAQEALNTRLEAELVQTLRLRLQTALSDPDH